MGANLEGSEYFYQDTVRKVDAVPDPGRHVDVVGVEQDRVGRDTLGTRDGRREPAEETGQGDASRTSVHHGSTDADRKAAVSLPWPLDRPGLRTRGREPTPLPPVRREPVPVDVETGWRQSLAGGSAATATGTAR